MFENEIAINEFLNWQFQKTVADIDPSSLYRPGVGHGHPPVWILGHLAIVGEFGQQMLGGKVSHPDWLPLFGPKSSGAISESIGLTKEFLASHIQATYADLRAAAESAAPELIAQPHGVAIFEGSSIKTISHCIALLLTNHFGFHLAQLSSCRRSQGFAAIF